MTAFKFPQRVNTPKGEATFIGYMTDGVSAQVSRWASAKEYSREECEMFKPSVADMSAGEYETWRTNAHINVNEIYGNEELSPANETTARPRKAAALSAMEEQPS